MSFLYFYKWLFGAENVLGLSINAPQDSAAIKSTQVNNMQIFISQ